MPWSIFTDGGGPGAAATWAVDLLKKIGAPITKGNEQFVFDWETSEGGGGKYNPLNQGPDIANPSLTSTGPQYGGGAADYVSWSAGLQGAADYLSYANFSAIRDALRANQPEQARADLIASPWAASHYGGHLSEAALPGQASALAPQGGDPSSSSSSSSPTSVVGAVTGLGADLKTYAIVTPLVVAGGALIVWGFARMTNLKQHAAAAAKTAETGALLA
jgi:hypothetical protein